MKERRFAWLILPLFIALFLISVMTPFGGQNNSENIHQGPTVQKIQSLYQKDDEILKHSSDDTKQGHSKIFTVNSLQIGEEIVQRLDNSPKVTHVHHNPNETSHFYENQIIVKFREDISEDQLNTYLTAINGQVLKKFDSIFTFESESETTVDLIQFFAPIDNVAYAEPNYIMMQNETTPNDIYYQRYQWNLPLIEAEAGWEITQGNEAVKIAVVDTGVDLEHPDLVERLTDGYNALTDSNDADDDNGHGTHVAGIIASKVNNHEGIAGLTWYNPIIPIKVMGEEGYGSTFDIAKGIIWATNQGAEVINLSLGNYQHSDMLKDAIDYAFKKDVVLIAASGNDNTSQPSFPAAYPQVLSVAAVDYYGDRANFSNYGDYIDVSAPGVQIASTYFNKQYAALSGTSMAAPHVSALAGLIRSINPELRNTEVMEIIKKTTVDLGDRGKDIYFGEGLIDVVNALEVASDR
ncbi:S8 family peptidase [Cytobacillus luteolus]|nr:S8 family peptidase [Cytobacillus luteolus]MBP1943634.1 subtilisin family serine protease [Cytobacillus luteolus]